MTSTRVLRLSALALALLVAAAPLGAQSPFRFSELRERADSFTVMVNGQAFGSATESVQRRAGRFVVESTVSVAVTNQHTAVTFSPQGLMERVVQDGVVGSANTHIDVTYANGRARGDATVPDRPNGTKSIVIDTIMPPTAVDDNAVQALLPTLDLREGATIPVSVFASGKGQLLAVTFAVTGTEEVTVPAGTFRAFRVQASGMEQKVTFFVSVAAPRRVVRVAIDGTPVTFDLAR